MQVSGAGQVQVAGASSRALIFCLSSLAGRISRGLILGDNLLVKNLNLLKWLLDYLNLKYFTVSKSIIIIK